MSKYTQSDDGKTVGGKVVVFLHPPRRNDGAEHGEKNGHRADRDPVAGGTAGAARSASPGHDATSAAAAEPALSRLTDPQWVEPKDQAAASYTHKARAR